MFIDQFGRAITYLRISVTDRCNLRCVYCMPQEGIQWQPHENIMRYEEIAQVVRVAAENGVKEIRLTGGEPLLRKKLSDLVGMIAAIPGIEDISLTTNGILLAENIEDLAAAGLKRINVSLDTLDAKKFAQITRGGAIERTWHGIESAEKLGLKPIKLNAVALKGFNDDEIVNMARLTLEHTWQMRFIELMPVRNQTSWGENFPDPRQMFMPVREIMELLRPLGLQTTGHGVGHGPAREYRLEGALGTIGFITPLSEAFCQSCDRLRLTADGHLRPCLLSDLEIPILEALRAGEDLLPYFQRAIDLKPMGHELEQNHTPSTRCMMQIGG